MGLLEELLAHQELKQSGSVMARDQKPEWRRNLPETLGPTLGTGVQTGMDLLDALLSFGPSPTDAVGSGAQILPATWKAMAPEAKAMMNQFGNKYPGMWGKVLASEPNVAAEVTKEMPAGAAGMLRKNSATSHQIKVRPDYAQNESTIGHELQHSLNAPRVTGTSPLDAATIATLLRDLQPAGSRGSLDMLLRQSLQPAPLMESLKSTFTGKLPPPVMKANAPAGLMRAAMDEGLAYTAQNAAAKGADPLLRLLAERLGVSW
jgi:hypothetical protein